MECLLGYEPCHARVGGHGLLCFLRCGAAVTLCVRVRVGLGLGLGLVRVVRSLINYALQQCECMYIPHQLEFEI
jgi:hypothetical protein